MNDIKKLEEEIEKATKKYNQAAKATFNPIDPIKRLKEICKSIPYRNKETFQEAKAKIASYKKELNEHLAAHIGAGTVTDPREIAKAQKAISSIIKVLQKIIKLTWK